MNTFVNAVNQVPDAQTANGASSFSTSLDVCVDLFAKGASLRANQAGLIDLFEKAWRENPVVAAKILLWMRDAREGAGERQSFRSIVRWLISRKAGLDTVDHILFQVIDKTPELGRWDDLVDIVDNFTGNHGKAEKFASVDEVTRAFSFASIAAQKIKEALDTGNGLCAKWMPRKGLSAHFLREQFGWTPKYYRKRLVELSNTVEQLMCARKWDEIDFSKLPSVAQFRYQGAFEKHQKDRYATFAAKAATGEVKVNASVIFPHTIAKQVLTSGTFNRDMVEAQWNALPDYVGVASVLPMIDVSGSMGKQVSEGTSALHVSVGLGLYCATKNSGAFKDVWLNFSTNCSIKKLTSGNIVDKIRGLDMNDWAMTTNIQKAFELILSIAVKNRVPQSEMPKTLLVLSDMQFNAACRYDETNHQAARRKFTEAGYEVPNIVYWNLCAQGDSPVRYNDAGTALISGFSPAILKSVLEGNLSEMTPQSTMLKTLSNPRYDVVI